jgi:hypothetical protein
MSTPDSIRDTIERLHAQLDRVILGKTTLTKALSRLPSVDLKRVQFTPYLLPTDILGSSVYNPLDGSFSFSEGPILPHLPGKPW